MGDQQLTPEDAQRQTKLAWKARAENAITTIAGGTCGWCQFVPSDTCIHCPIHKIARMSCWRITEYLRCQNATEPAELKAAASAVLEWLEKHEEQLIEIGHEILAKRKKK